MHSWDMYSGYSLAYPLGAGFYFKTFFFGLYVLFILFSSDVFCWCLGCSSTVGGPRIAATGELPPQHCAAMQSGFHVQKVSLCF